MQVQDFWKDPEIVQKYATGGNAVQQQRFHSAASWLEAHPIKKNEIYVDIGSGTAEISMIFATVNGSGQNYAVDYSEAMVRVAHNRLKKSKISNLQIWTSDATKLKLPLAEQTVDRMTSFTAIHWFPDLEGFINGVNKYLAPGGVFFFRYAGCKDDETLELAEQICQNKTWQEKFKGFVCPMHTHSVSKMQELLEKVGLVWEECDQKRNVEIFDNREAYKKYVQGWLPHLYYLENKEDREAFLDTVVKTHCARPDRVNGEEISVWDTQIKITGFKPTILLCNDATACQKDQQTSAKSRSTLVVDEKPAQASNTNLTSYSKQLVNVGLRKLLPR